MDAFLLVKIVHDGRVLAGEGFEALFPAGIRKAATIEDEAAAVAGFVLGQFAVKRKAEDSDDKIVSLEGKALQFFRGEHALERAEKGGQLDGERDVVQEPANVFERIGDALEKMCAAFEEAAIAVSTERLHDADVNVGVEMAQERFAINGDEAGERAKIIVEELLAEAGREVGLGVEEKRGEVVLQSAFAAALVVDEEGLAVSQHDVAGLEVAVKKVVARGAEKEIGEAREIVLESMFVEGNASEPEKIVFEVIHIPGDGLAIEARGGIAEAVVQIAGSFDLEAREDGNNFAVGFNDGGGDGFAGAIFGEKLEKRGVTEVFFEIGAVIEVFGINFGHRQAMAAKMFGEFNEGNIFFTPAIKNSDGAGFAAGESDDFAAGAAEIALKRLNVRGQRVEMLFEEFLENVHGNGSSHSVLKIRRAGWLLA